MASLDLISTNFITIGMAVIELLVLSVASIQILQIGRFLFQEFLPAFLKNSVKKTGSFSNEGSDLESDGLRRRSAAERKVRILPHQSASRAGAIGGRVMGSGTFVERKLGKSQCYLGSAL